MEAIFNYTYLLEIQISSTTQLTYSFGELLKFDESYKICGIEALTGTETAKSPLGRTMLTTTQLKSAFLTFQNQQQEERISQVPGYTLYPYANNGLRFWFADPFSPKWPSCKLSFETNVSLTNPSSACFNIFLLR